MVAKCGHEAHRFLCGEGESGVTPSQHNLGLVSSGAPVSPPPSPRIVTRGNETHSPSLACWRSRLSASSVQGHCLPHRHTHKASTWTSQVSRTDSTSSFPRVLLNSKPPHGTCRERVNTVLASGWGLRSHCLPAGLAGPLCDSLPSLMIMLCTKL